MNDVEIAKILALILALMIAIIGHEIMHGYSALRFGDTTARDANRLSINPLRHIDPIGTIAVPALLYFSGAPFLFGWAKPVPIDVRVVMQNAGYKGAIIVSLAGIAYNFALAALATLVFLALKGVGIQSVLDAFLLYFALYLVVYNVVLGFFNLWPIPPLDGSKALGYFSLSMGWHKVVEVLNKVEPYGMILLILVIATPLAEYFFLPINLVLSFLL